MKRSGEQNAARQILSVIAVGAQTFPVFLAPLCRSFLFFLSSSELARVRAKVKLKVEAKVFYPVLHLILMENEDLAIALKSLPTAD